VYSSVTTLCKKARSQTALTAALPAPQLSLPLRALHYFLYLQHQKVKVSKAAGSVIMLWLNREEKPTLPTAAHSDLNLEYFNYIHHNTLHIFYEKRAHKFLIYCLW